MRLHHEGKLTDEGLVDLAGFTNTIITHITDGNRNEERMVNIMGGTVIMTKSEELMQQGIDIGKNIGKIQMLIEIGQEQGLDAPAILASMQDRLGLSLTQAAASLEQYGKKIE